MALLVVRPLSFFVSLFSTAGLMCGLFQSLLKMPMKRVNVYMCTLAVGAKSTVKCHSDKTFCTAFFSQLCWKVNVQRRQCRDELNLLNKIFFFSSVKWNKTSKMSVFLKYHPETLQILPFWITSLSSSYFV